MSKLSKEVKKYEKAFNQADAKLSKLQGQFKELGDRGKKIQEDLAEQAKIAQERLDGIRASLNELTPLIQEAGKERETAGAVLTYLEAQLDKYEEE